MAAAIVTGLVGFVGMFMFARLSHPAAEPSEVTAPLSQTSQTNQSAFADQQAGLEIPQSQATAPVTGTVGIAQSEMGKNMTQKRLKKLIYEVREKIQEYNNKLSDLQKREQRLQTVQNTIKDDIDELNNLQTELVSLVTNLKSQQDKLLKTRVEIAGTEKNNLMSIAATYDKMEPEAAGKILTSMSQAKDESADDAVKILHYMGERTKGELLAGLADSEPKLAAYFCKKLKQITEN